MTGLVVNPSPSTPISINTLILLAYKRAGILPVEATLAGANMVPKLEHGRQLLDIIIDSLATEGFFARSTEFHDLVITPGEPYYTLPDQVLDVFEDAMFVPASGNADTKYTVGELICKPIDLSTWQTLTTKGSISTRPQLYVAVRSGAQCEVRFWPVPSDAGTMRLKVVRLLGANSDGKKNVDLQRYWFDALIWILAKYVAIDSGMPADRCAMLGSEAEARKAAALRYSFEHTSQQAVFSYTTQWSE